MAESAWPMRSEPMASASQMAFGAGGFAGVVGQAQAGRRASA
jgi:hypothetical protein